MKRLIFAGNWKMHHGPHDARAFLDAWRPAWKPDPAREVWIFPPAPSLPAIVAGLEGVDRAFAGIQHVHWESQGAFTGETSVAIAAQAGATHALVGHSERRHVFGETDDECRRKVVAVLQGGLTPVLCVGETLEQREAGETERVVLRQLSALDGLEADALARVVIAYEPVWAIGTGRTATPDDADQVQGRIRSDLARRGADRGRQSILYGGSVKPGNVAALLGRDHVDGVLVGGASLDPAQWAAITAATPD